MSERTADRGDRSSPGNTVSGAERTLPTEIARWLVTELQPHRIYLFGSRSHGDAHPDSDYHLLDVVKERTGEKRKMEQRANAAMWGLKARVDSVVMSADSSEWMLGAAASVPATVQREGRLLHVA